MMLPKRLPLTRKAFTTWLESLEPNTPVGTTHKGEACPIAVYLRSEYPNVDWWVAKKSVAGKTADDYIRYPLRAWACDYIKQIDMQHEVRTALSAAEALTLLKEI